jgi:hypothetical protein
MNDVLTDIMSCILATRHRARAPEDCDEQSEGLEAKCANLTHALVSGHKQRPDVVTFDMLREGDRISGEILASYAITKEQSDGLEKIYQAVRLAELLGNPPALAKIACDQINDNAKKAEKKVRKRRMTAQAVECVKRYRTDPLKLPMKSIVEDYAEEKGKSASSIMRVLNDNPEQWKDDQ